MPFDNVEVQSNVEVPVAAESYTPAQQIAVESQRGALSTTSAITDSTLSFLPALSFESDGNAVELAPPGAPFSLHRHEPDPRGPNLRPDVHGGRTLPRVPNAMGDQAPPNMVPNAPSDETAPDDPTVPNMVPDARRRLPNAKPEIDFDALGGNDAIRSHMTPGKPGDPKPFGKEFSIEGAAQEMGEKIKEAAKQERMREILRNFLGHSRKPKV